MSSWLWIPLVAATLYSFSSFVDNFLIDNYAKRLHAKASQGLFLATSLVVLVVLAVLLGGEIFAAGNLWPLLGAGAVNTLAGVFYWRSLQKANTTEVTLLMQFSPLIALCCGTLFLGQAISLAEFCGFLLILAAAIVVILAAGAKHLRVNLKTAGLVLVCCVIWVLSDVVFASVSDSSVMLPSFFWLLAGSWLTNLGLFAALKSWRRDFRSYLRRGHLRSKIFWTSLNEFTWTIAELAWRYGVLVAPLALLSVVQGVAQIIITFLLGIVLTWIRPNFGREKLTKKKLAHHAVAAAMMVAGVVIIG